MPPETVGEAKREQQGARPSKAARFTPKQPSEPPGIPVYAQTNYGEENLFDARERTEVKGKTVISPDEDLDAVINMETTVEDQAGGRSAEEMDVLRRKQAFLQNLSGMVEGYAQHNIQMQEAFIDTMENEVGGIENFSIRLVCSAVGDRSVNFLKANNAGFICNVAMVMIFGVHEA